MCDKCQSSTLPKSEGETKSKRLWLWDFTDNVHCPLIGTCLTSNDLLTISRRLKLEVNPECKDYDLHSYFVTVTTKDCREARAVHKLLDERHAGALRRFKRLKCDEEVTALWNEMKSSGHIASAFYAIMTLRHVSLEIRGIVFGEVHMLSHLMGASYRERSLEVACLKQRLDEMTARKTRVEIGLHQALTERDEKIAELENKLRVANSKAQPANFVKIIRKQNAQSDKRNRAVETARAKARIAEAEKQTSDNLLRKYRKRIFELQKKLKAEKKLEKIQPEMIKLDGQSILYVGGRPSQISNLEKTVDFFGAKFLHHDGGKEDAINRLDEVLPSVDCVICPINCVSHDACLRAKAGCKKHGKTFVPLRSASQASLRQALLNLEPMVSN